MSYTGVLCKIRIERVRVLINSLFSPIFLMPSQRASTPVSPREISKAVFEELNVEFMIAVNVSVSPPPKKNNYYKGDNKDDDKESYPNVIQNYS